MPSTIWSGAISFGLVTSLNYVAHRALVGILWGWHDERPWMIKTLLLPRLCGWSLLASRTLWVPC